MLRTSKARYEQKSQRIAEKRKASSSSSTRERSILLALRVLVSLHETHGQWYSLRITSIGVGL